MAIVQDFKFIYVNKAFIAMVGYSLEELNQMEPTHIIATEDKKRLTTQHRRRMKGDKEVKISVAAFIRKDGTKFIAEFNSSLVVIGGKEASYIAMRDHQALPIQKGLLVKFWTPIADTHWPM